MKVSIIIPTYNDNQALTLILDALQLQTYKDFEIIVAEDNNSFETKELLEKYISLYMITHISHENMGNRKAIIMNRALEVANGKYIICIDGDTIPFSTFIEHHVSLSGENTILCGRRVNLGTKVSS
ncbi:MAG TPA: glycosyltransferase, partial [Campylobacterales bacterium]|nr:glycosyltransferase [Campylobacterales bacterium]